MTEADHENKIREIRDETEEIKRQIMQLEFHHKKDIVESDRRFDARMSKIESAVGLNQKQIDQLIALVGFAYDELDSVDATLTATGVVLTRPRNAPESTNHTIVSVPAHFIF